MNEITKFLVNAVEPLGWTLIHFLWQGCLVAILFAGVRNLFQRQSAQLRYGLGCVCLFVLILFPLGTFTWFYSSSPATQNFESNQYVQGKQQEQNSNLVASWFSSTKTNKEIGKVASKESKFESQMLWVVWVWGIGVLFFSIRLGLGWLKIRVLVREAIPLEGRENLVEDLKRRIGVRSSIRLLQSARIDVPAVMGCIRPVIVFPASALVGLSPEQFEMVLCHELSHIRRRDTWINLLQCFVEVLFFYHPAVWWISSVIREEREYCCDDEVIAICENRLGYAKALSELETMKGLMVEPALGIKGKQGTEGRSLLTRIQRVLNVNNKNSKGVKMKENGITGGIMIITAMAFVVAGVSVFSNFSVAANQSGVEVEKVRGEGQMKKVVRSKKQIEVQVHFVELDSLEGINLNQNTPKQWLDYFHTKSNADVLAAPVVTLEEEQEGEIEVMQEVELFEGDEEEDVGISMEVEASVLDGGKIEFEGELEIKKHVGVNQKNAKEEGILSEAFDIKEIHLRGHVKNGGTYMVSSDKVILFLSFQIIQHTTTRPYRVK